MTTTLRLGKLGLILLVALTFGCQNRPTNYTLRQEGAEATAKRKYDQAALSYGQAVAQNPTDWRAQIGLGEANMRLQRWFEAELALEYALTLRPEHKETPTILDNLAECLFQQGKQDELYQLLLNATQTYVTSGDFLRQANYLAKIGDIDGAKLAYRKAAHFADVTDVEPYLAQAAFFETIGDQESAIIALRRAYNVAPRDPQVGNRLRRYGIVPGPTVALPLDREDPPTEEIVGQTEVQRPRVNIQFPTFGKTGGQPTDDEDGETPAVGSNSDAVEMGPVVNEDGMVVQEDGTTAKPMEEEPTLIELPAPGEAE